MSDQDAIIIEPQDSAKSCIIWLHGLGADGSDFEPVASQLAPSVTQGTRFIFPNAPSQAITINDGAVMPAWYDILEMDLERKVDHAGVEASAELISAMIETQHELGIPYSQIVLAGFSQGGAIALHLGLRYKQRLAGIMALSTYIPIRQDLSHEACKSNAGLPIFLGHGSQDPMVPLAASEQARLLLRSLGFRPACHTYEIAHAVCGEELRDISCWLEDVLDR